MLQQYLVKERSGGEMGRKTERKKKRDRVGIKSEVGKEFQY